MNRRGFFGALAAITGSIPFLRARKPEPDPTKKYVDHIGMSFSVEKIEWRDGKAIAHVREYEIVEDLERGEEVNLTPEYKSREVT